MCRSLVGLFVCVCLLLRVPVCVCSVLACLFGCVCAVAWFACVIVMLSGCAVVCFFACLCVRLTVCSVDCPCEITFVWLVVNLCACSYVRSCLCWFVSPCLYLRLRN